MVGIVTLCLAVGSTGVILLDGPLTFDQAAREAETIVSCRVVKVTPRWGDASRRWIQTEYTIEVDDTPAPTERVKKGAKLSVVVWGGTLGEETYSIDDVPYMEEGKSYVLMLKPGWTKGEGFSPVVGFFHGFFPVVADDRSDRKIVVDYAGRPVYAVADGARLALSADSKDVAESRQRVTPAELMEILRGDLRRIQALPAREPPVRAARGDGEPKLPLKKHAQWRASGVSAERVESIEPTARTLKGLIEPEAPAQERIVEVQAKAIAHEEDHAHDDVVKGFAKYVVIERVNPPVVINQFTADMAPWSPVDQECMAIWNGYVTNLIRVKNTPSDDAAFGDGVFDLHGWMDDAELRARFGEGWEGGVGICFRHSRSGVIVEADIALNIADDFTLKDETVLDGADRYPFRYVMLHELGHLIGLEHSDEHAMMVPNAVRPLGGNMRPFMDDAEGLRALYPNQAISRNDLGVYLYYYQGGKWTDCTMPKNVTAGGTMTINDFTLENVGTVTVTSPKVEFYLCTQRNYTGTHYYVGTVTYTGSLERFASFVTSALTVTFTVPNAPAGSYYLGAYIRGDQSHELGVYPFNNSQAFSRKKITVN